ncbi:hypothetical protein FOL47_002828 [Perkinsus chesapeaki]|uniref:Uncharacterized protein n=1 Tax=Perkinsus chesapeaki TaxID=330153 RepID=A0A7J6MCY5_PERCH|nr:hypothetical protein FOL47_002828 [Perkinsus chesapeaki]
MKSISDLIQGLCSDPQIGIVEAVAQHPPERRVLKPAGIRNLTIRLSLAPPDSTEEQLLLAASALLSRSNCDAMNDCGMLDTVAGKALTGGIKSDRRSSTLADLMARQRGRSSASEAGQCSYLGRILELGDVHLPGGGRKVNSGNLSLALLLIAVPVVSGNLSQDLVSRILDLVAGSRMTDVGFRTHGVSLLAGMAGKLAAPPTARQASAVIARLPASLYTGRVGVALNVLRELRESGAGLGECVRPLTDIVLCERSPGHLLVESATLLACDDVDLSCYYERLRKRFEDLYSEHFSNNDDVDAVRAGGRMACAVVARLVVRAAGSEIDSTVNEDLSERLLEVLRQLVYVKSEAGLLTPRTVVKMHMELSWLKGEDPFAGLLSDMAAEGGDEASSTTSMSVDSSERSVGSQSSGSASPSEDSEPQAKRLKVEPKRFPLKRPRHSPATDRRPLTPSSIHSMPCPPRQGPLLKRHRTCHPAGRDPPTFPVPEKHPPPRVPGKSLLRRLPSNAPHQTDRLKGRGTCRTQRTKKVHELAEVRTALDKAYDEDDTERFVELQERESTLETEIAHYRDVIGTCSSKIDCLLSDSSHRANPQAPTDLSLVAYNDSVTSLATVFADALAKATSNGPSTSTPTKMSDVREVSVSSRTLNDVSLLAIHYRRMEALSSAANFGEKDEDGRFCPYDSIKVPVIEKFLETLSPLSTIVNEAARHIDSPTVGHNWASLKDILLDKFCSAQAVRNEVKKRVAKLTFPGAANIDQYIDQLRDIRTLHLSTDHKCTTVSDTGVCQCFDQNTHFIDSVLKPVPRDLKVQLVRTSFLRPVNNTSRGTT